MSLCNTFRLFVVSLIIVLSSIDAPAAFTLHRITSGERRDLTQEETVLVEVKHEIEPVVNSQDIISSKKNSDNLNLEAYKTNYTTDISTNESNITEVSDNTQNQTTSIENQSSSDLIKSSEINSSDLTTEILTNNKRDINEVNEEISSTEDTLSNRSDNIQIKNFPSNTRLNEFIQSETTTETSTLAEVTTGFPLKLDDLEVTTIFESERLPLWKKYTTIDRKRQPTTLNGKVGSKDNEMTKSETKQSRISIHDTVTSDIPSLEHLKNDLLYSTSKEQSLEIKEESLNLLTTEIDGPLEITTSIALSPTEEVISLTRWDTVESKRAGYLDLSEKVKNEETLTAKETSDFKISPKETLRAMFEIENSESDISDEKTENGAKSQGQLDDDTIKEELLKEKIINDNEENVKRFDIKDQVVTEMLNNNEKQQEQTNSSIDEKLNVRPISSDKIKNISLYSVSSNYKPLKKIEVQAPKQFVRDPDDNTWRNESLNSLGIVFKSNNSSKPFTQVLKNKTEAELNSLSEKDSKNDIPDLRERLQKMAEKRKSKRKKTDSYGNVVYFDYEENSSSREHISKEDLSSVTSIPETTSGVDRTSINSSENPSVITTSMITTSENIRDKMRDTYSTRKFKKFFKLPEYYDTTEEDDADYLNMAKIDIKKFSTSPKTTTTTIGPVTPRNWGINRLSSTISPERKATIQYFPPLTTQKVNIHDYDNDFKLKVNSFTSTEPPKHVLPVTVETPKAPENPFQYKHFISERPNSFEVTNKQSFQKKFYPTQPPQTTQTAFTLLNVDGTFDRDSYGIRHYKDFINEAAKDNEFDKNLEYIPYTQSPEKYLTKTELITYPTEKVKVNLDQEYDYETKFRKEVLQKFVNNFNQNSERFKSEFPVLFNNSIIHRDTQNGREIASSRAFMRGLNKVFKPKTPPKDYDPNNDNITVELSPSYELHYYMPDQEETEEVVQQPVTLPYQYRL